MIKTDFKHAIQTFVLCNSFHFFSTENANEIIYPPVVKSTFNVIKILTKYRYYIHLLFQVHF